MKVVLLVDIKGTGKKNDIVEVSDGFAKNFLLKNKKAIIADNSAINQANAEKEAKQFHYAEKKKAAEELKKKLNSICVNLKIKAGENGKVFGSVGNKEIAEELCKLGYEIDKKSVIVKSPIKNLGEYKIEVKLFEGINAQININVKGME